MSKDCELIFSKKQSAFDKDACTSNQDQRYNNLNLNQNGPTYMKAEQSVSTTTFNDAKKDYAKQAVDQLKTPHSTLNSLEKAENGLQRLSLEDRDDTGESKWKNRQETAATPGSTLSLHIAAYENAIEQAPNGTNNESGGGESAVEKKEKTMKLGKTWKNVKDVLNGTSSSATFSNYFEFPRHPSKAPTSKPEIMQFKASQKLSSHAAADARRPGLLEAADELSKSVERKEISKEEFKVRLQARSPELGYHENGIYTAWGTYVRNAEKHFEKEEFKFDSPLHQMVADIERRLNPEFCQAPPVLNDSRADVSNENRVDPSGLDEPAASGAASNPIVQQQQPVQIAVAPNSGSNLMRENVEEIQGINVQPLAQHVTPPNDSVAMPLPDHLHQQQQNNDDATAAHAEAQQQRAAVESNPVRADVIDASQAADEELPFEVYNDDPQMPRRSTRTVQPAAPYFPPSSSRRKSRNPVKRPSGPRGPSSTLFYTIDNLLALRQASAAANATEQASPHSFTNERQQTNEGVVENGAQVTAQQIIREPYSTGFITAINQSNGIPPVSRSVTFQIPNQHQQNGGDERRQNENVHVAPSNQSNRAGPLVERRAMPSNNFFGSRSRTVPGNIAHSLFAAENLNGGGNAILHQRPAAAPILPQQPSNDAAFNGIHQQQQPPVQMVADANAETPPSNGANLIPENVEQTQNGTAPPMPQHGAPANLQNPALNEQPQPRQQPQYIFFFGNDQNLDVLRTVLSGNNA